MITLPQEKDTRWINTLIDEQDSLIVGEALFHRIGGDSADEHEGITSALHTDYSQISRTQRVFSSPFVSTYLNLQRSTHFDAILITPEINEDQDIIHQSRYRGVFLHPLKRSICQFHIEKDDEGRWIPDERKVIDPWIADNIGHIIINNL